MEQPTEQTENIYSAPQVSEVASTTTGTHTPLTLKQKLWGFKGRISRAGFWGYSVHIVLIAIPYIILSTLATMDPESPNAALSILAFLCYIPVLWASFAVQIKRWHDRGKSGWWSLISLIPIIGSIWTFVELGCLAGEQGHNRFGDDPLLADGKTHA